MNIVFTLSPPSPPSPAPSLPVDPGLFGALLEARIAPVDAALPTALPVLSDGRGEDDADLRDGDAPEPPGADEDASLAVMAAFGLPGLTVPPAGIADAAPAEAKGDDAPRPAPPPAARPTALPPSAPVGVPPPLPASAAFLLPLLAPSVGGQPAAQQAVPVSDAPQPASKPAPVPLPRPTPILAPAVAVFRPVSPAFPGAASRPVPRPVPTGVVAAPASAPVEATAAPLAAHAARPTGPEGATAALQVAQPIVAPPVASSMPLPVEVGAPAKVGQDGAVAAAVAEVRAAPAPAAPRVDPVEIGVPAKAAAALPHAAAFGTADRPDRDPALPDASADGAEAASPVSGPGPAIADHPPHVRLPEAAHRSEGLAVARHIDLARNMAWLDGLARDMAATTAPGSRLKIMVAPESLGPVDLEVRRSEGGVSVHMAARSDAARTVLAAAQPQIADELRAHGVQLTHSEIVQGHAAPDDGRAGHAPHRPVPLPVSIEARLLPDPAGSTPARTPMADGHYA